MVVFGVLLHFTPFGRGLYAIGYSKEAARFVGIHVARSKFWLYVASGGVSALAGIFWTLRYSSARTDNASGLELAVIAAVLLGGVSIFGGKGSIPGVVAGVLLIGTINYALRLGRVSDVVLIIVTGTLLIVSVVAPSIFDAVKRRRHDRRLRRELPQATTPSGSVQRLAPGARRKEKQWSCSALAPAGHARRRHRGHRRSRRDHRPHRHRLRRGGGSATGGGRARTGDQTITFIPKQLNNPYTDVVLGGGEEGAEAAGFASSPGRRPARRQRVEPGLLHQRRDPGGHQRHRHRRERPRRGLLRARGGTRPAAPRSSPSTRTPTPTAATSSSARSWPRRSR